MLNIPLLRKVQESISDPSNPFNMNGWDTCICGHLKSVVLGIPVATVGSPFIWTGADGARQLGIPFEVAADLFAPGYLTREQAITALEALITASTQPVSQPEPVEPPPAPERELSLACV